MDSSDSSLRFRVCEVSQVPVRTFDTRPPALPRPLHTSYVVRRRTILASSIRRDWPADRNLHEASTHGSLALELMSSSDKTPARQSPSARLIFLLTFRHLYEISSFQLTSSAKLVLAYTNLGYTKSHSSLTNRQPHLTLFVVKYMHPCESKVVRASNRLGQQAELLTICDIKAQPPIN